MYRHVYWTAVYIIIALVVVVLVVVVVVVYEWSGISIPIAVELKELSLWSIFKINIRITCV